MSETFDPYYKWLGIPPADQPPHHYRLLAIELFEADADVIAGAADQRMAHIRSFQTGKYSNVSQKILNEISAARVCLLTPAKKIAYDAALRADLKKKRQPAAVEVQDAARPTIDLGFDVASLRGSASGRTGLSARKRLSWLLPAAVVASLVVAIGIAALVGGSLLQSGGQHKELGQTDANPPLHKTEFPSPPPAKIETPSPPAAKIEDFHHPGRSPPKFHRRSRPRAKCPSRNRSLPHPCRQKLLRRQANLPRHPPAKPETPEEAKQRLEDALAKAQSPDDFKTVGEGALAAVGRAAAAGKRDLAAGLAKLALHAARKANDNGLANQATLQILDLETMRK